MEERLTSEYSLQSEIYALYKYLIALYKYLIEVKPIHRIKSTNHANKVFYGRVFIQKENIEQNIRY